MWKRNKEGYLVKVETTTTTKKCHACGQRLPLKVGQFVSGVNARRPFQGTVTGINQGGSYATIVDLDGNYHFAFPIDRLTRLHGYYRITERETMA